MIASSIAAAGIGSAPAWKATPSSSVSANWSSPNSASASARASRTTPASVRVRSVMRRRTASASGKETVGSTTIAPVGTFADEIAATVRHDEVVARFDGLGGDQQVGAEVEVALALGRPARRLERRAADLDVGDDRAALLREAGLVEPAHVAPGHEPGGGEDLGHRRHPGAADARRSAR